ncbi:FimV/HubP family polar landmark protein [Pseudidiomarina halophila]|uniref:Pilus assembly protein FimV n=1 Tax=Pseudidiomarina halophila TaxID=1449799 RepID=A0A432XZC0_9GAMM|nr:FimV/HubP family polar landmark protein [Pseudidiomarina halophila]RUO54060.1 hypothetical protein CWI69_01105 [Pseudidiomarina halophila]
MARIILAAIVAAFVAFSAATMAQQSSRASRWQPDQFGPIVQTDTMWSIATYYGRQRGVSVYEMMDVIVAENPRAFRDNRPDFMLTGFYLDIPPVGNVAQANDTPKAAVAEANDTAEATTTDSAEETPLADTASSENAAVNTTEVENEIAISVSEMQALRGQLSESIDLIESLQTENSDLQQRLELVTRELELLRQAAAEEQRASAEMESIAQQINEQGTEELTQATVGEQPRESNPALDDTTDADAGAAVDTGSEAATDEVTTDAQDTAVAERQETVTPAAESQPEQAKPAVTRSSGKQSSWLDWLLKPLHLGLLALVLIIVFGSLWYFAYVRRLEREMAESQAERAAEKDIGTETEDPEQAAVAAAAQEEQNEVVEHRDAAATDATDELVRATREEITDDQVDPTSEEFAEQTSAPMEADDWQEQATDPMTTQDRDVEVTDVDLDAYLREQSDGATGAEETDDDDPISKEVDALLAFEPSVEEDEKPAETRDPEEVSEYRVVDEPDSEDADSFGGLRLDDDMTTTPVPAKDDIAETERTETESTETESPETDLNEDQETSSDSSKTTAEDDDYLSIESLMDEADTEASEEHEDPYDKDKINEALAGEDTQDLDYDLSTEAMLDESKSPAARLDLAQVYIDMGEVDDARNLLESIQGCGDEEAEQEAAALLKKLSEQGGR